MSVNYFMFDLKAWDFPEYCGPEINSCCDLKDFHNFNSVGQLSQEKFDILKERTKRKKLRYAKKESETFTCGKKKKNSSYVEEPTEIPRCKKEKVLYDLHRSGLNKRVRSISLWLQSINQIFNKKLPKLIKKKIHDIDRSREASLACQIAAYQFKSIDLKQFEKDIQIYKKN